MDYHPDGYMAATICNYISGHASMQANDYRDYLNGPTAPTKTSEVAARVYGDGVNSVLAVRGGLGRMRRLQASDKDTNETTNVSWDSCKWGARVRTWETTETQTTNKTRCDD